MLALVVRRAAGNALVGRERRKGQPAGGRFTKGDVDALLRQSWRNFDLLSPTIPWETTAGARMNLVFSALTISVYQALLDAQVEEAYATRLMADAIWEVYQKWGTASRFISLAKSRDRSDRLRTSIRLFLRFPFNPPSYEREDISGTPEVAFNITRYPVADYFSSRGLSKLCVATWCNQDFALAEMWGGKLIRTKTIAGGSPRCDFVFKPVDVRRGARPASYTDLHVAGRVNVHEIADWQQPRPATLQLETATMM